MGDPSSPQPLVWREDALLNGRLRLRQPASGHRSGTDAVLLAAAAPAGFSGLAVDLGAGVGAVGVALALRERQARLRLVEIDPELGGGASANAALNGVEERVSVVVADVLASRTVRVAAGLTAGDADLVLTNPPFAEAGSGRASPDARRRRAHVLEGGDLDAWMKAATDMLRPRGDLIVIHRADALPALLKAMERRFGGIVVKPVQPREGEAAIRVLVRGTKGSRAPFSIRPPLVLHAEGGGFTPQAAALHSGDSLLEW